MKNLGTALFDHSLPLIITHISLQEYSRKPNWVIHITQLTFQTTLNNFYFLMTRNLLKVWVSKTLDAYKSSTEQASGKLRNTSDLV